MRVEKTERGWAGHFCDARNCLFHRNTLLIFGPLKIVVSTVGNWFIGEEVHKLGSTHYYETMVFFADNSKFQDAITRTEYQIDFKTQGRLKELDDVLANNMHERVVIEMTQTLELTPQIINDQWKRIS
jgi:hypothetical protein